MDPGPVAEAVAVRAHRCQQRAIACERRVAVVDSNVADDSGGLRVRGRGDRRDENAERGECETRDAPAAATASSAECGVPASCHGPTLGSGPNSLLPEI